MSIWPGSEGFYYLKRLTAWAQWQVCHEENNSQKQMQGRVTNMSATTVRVRQDHPHQGKKKKGSEKKEHLFPWSQFLCQTEHLSVFCVWNKQDLHSKIMSKVQRVESWEFSRGWINEVCWLAGLHSALHEVSPWGPGWCVALILCPCASITWFGM